MIDCVSKVNTGGKFNDDVFQFSVGLNGIGTKAVNALSREFEVVSYRDGKFVQGLFRQGKLVSQKQGKDPKAKQGCLFRFAPDPAIFQSFAWNDETATLPRFDDGRGPAVDETRGGRSYFIYDGI